MVVIASFAALWGSGRDFVSARPKLRNPIVARIFSNANSKIVTSDSGLVLLQDTLRRLVSLEEYFQADYPRSLTNLIAAPDLRAAMQRGALRPYTNYSDVNSVAQLVILGRENGVSPVIRHPRQLSRRDFETGSFVLLGGRLANPWYSLFEPRLNFVFEGDAGDGDVHIRNRNPRAGEQRDYSVVEGRDGETTFAVLSLVPNLGGTGPVLLLAGIDRPGTEGAEDLVLQENLRDDLATLCQRKEIRGGYFEALLKVRAIAGVPRETSIVAGRPLSIP